jgi:hypothetical protein
MQKAMITSNTFSWSLMCSLSLGWMRVLKQKKTGKEVASAFKDTIASSGRKPKQVWSDKATEFYNNHFKKLEDVYTTENEGKSCVVELWNRTTKY